jgi:hypothetical protein
MDPGRSKYSATPEEALVPTMIVNGENVAKFAPIVFREAGATTPHRFTGATWNRSGEPVQVLSGYRDVANIDHSGW